MLVTVKRTNGKIENIELRDDMYIEIGDILSDGSEVIDLKYPDDIDDDMFALDIYWPMLLRKTNFWVDPLNRQNG